jgi:hypothetical protein
MGSELVFEFLLIVDSLCCRGARIARAATVENIVRPDSGFRCAVSNPVNVGLIHTSFSASTQRMRRRVMCLERHRSCVKYRPPRLVTTHVSLPYSRDCISKVEPCGRLRDAPARQNLETAAHFCLGVGCFEHTPISQVTLESIRPRYRTGHPFHCIADAERGGWRAGPRWTVFLPSSVLFCKSLILVFSRLRAVVYVSCTGRNLS